MRNFRVAFLVFIISMLAQNVEAQFLKRLAKHAEDKIEREADRRAQRKVDEKIDKGLDKVEDKMEKDRTQKVDDRKQSKETKRAERIEKSRQVNQDSPEASMDFPTSELKAGTFSSNPYPLIAHSSRRLKRYGIKSGMVQYEKTISGKVLTSTVEGAGAMSLYFKDWGAVEMSEDVANQTTNSSFFGKKSSETSHSHSMARMDNGEMHGVDFDQKIILLRRDPAMDMMRETNSDVGEAGEHMLESMGGKKVGTERFMGYTCDVWEVLGGEQWVYKGVVLKLDITVMGIRTVQVATSAKFNVSVPEKYFRLPDFPLKKMDGYLDNEDYEKEQKRNREDLDKLSKMTYPEFKRMAKDDPEMKNMSDDELRQSFDMMKKMTKALKDQ